MRTSPTFFCSIVAIALLALSPTASIPAQAESTNVTIEEQEGDDGLPKGRRATVEEPEAENSGGVTVARPADESFFPISDDPPGLPPLAPGKDIVTCLAGCDGPRGVIVYKK